MSEKLSQKIEATLLEIEKLRKDLEIYNKNNSDLKNINNAEMLKISRALDIKINEYYKLINKPLGDENR